MNPFVSAADARAMHLADKALREASRRSFGGPKWMAAGVAFLREGMQRGCLSNLNELAEALDWRTQLSERSIDELFESGAATDAFVAHLRLEADRDAEFKAQLRREFGEGLLTRPLAQEDMFA